MLKTVAEKILVYLCDKITSHEAIGSLGLSQKKGHKMVVV